MDYENFKSYITEHIKEYLPEEYQGADISFIKKIKNNDTVLEGLQIMEKDARIVPVLYINGAYEAYQGGEEIDDVVSKLADSYMESSFKEKGFIPDMPLGAIGQYERVKDKIFCRLVNREANKKLLQDRPFTPVEDLAVTYHIMIKSSGDGIGSIAITEAMMDLYGVDTAALHEQAVANMEKLSPPVIQPLQTVLASYMLPEFMEEYGLSEEEAKKNLEMIIPENAFGNLPEIICISNASGINGAVCIISPEVRQKVAEKIGGDYYVIPSSVHEVLAVPKREDLHCAALQDMVQSVNGSEVKEDEVLSSRVYEYNAKDRVFHIADSVQEIGSLKMTQEKELQKHSAKLH